MTNNNSEKGKESYVMPEEDVNRLLSRYSHMEILKSVQVAKSHYGDNTKKVKQGMYIHYIGTIPNFEQLPNSRAYDSEIVEQYLEKARLYENEDQLRQKREEFAVIEDDFGPALEKMLKGGKVPSFDNLYEACKAIDKKHINMHHNKSKATYQYFTKLGVSKNDAVAYAMAIAFYTGGYSAPLTMEATVLARMGRTAEDMGTSDSSVDSNAAMIMYYLIRGLSHIEFYWGTVIRYVKLEDKVVKNYKPGEIVTWLQFSSSDKGGKDMSHFTDRNTIFVIYSLSGRAIQQFSNCANEEDEVLFLPHSCFLVCHVEKIHTGQNKIYLRQVIKLFIKFMD